MITIKRALISVYNKEGIVELCRELQSIGIELLYTKGTGIILEKNGIYGTEISRVTGYKELLEGRVKTLHPKIFAGLLAKKTELHERELEQNKIGRIALLIVNLYPFEDVIKKENVTLDDALENIDIGGVALIRAGAKNFTSTVVLTNPGQYKIILNELHENRGNISIETSKKFAVESFEYAASYDFAIYNYLHKIAYPDTRFTTLFADQFKKERTLRYGENPHQKAAVYYSQNPVPWALSNCELLVGKELSFNNIIDIDSAIEIVRDFEEPCAVIIKHGNPCGVSIKESISRAFESALNCDKMSAYGGIVALNRKVDVETAKNLKKVFTEAIIATDYEPEALEILKTKKKGTILKLSTMMNKIALEKTPFEIRSFSGGLLVQEKDRRELDPKSLKVVTRRSPTENELKDLLFAWKVVKYVKSNGIVLVKEQCTTGIGTGQMSRVFSVQIAIEKAGENAKDSVLASDAFFPFPDSIEVAGQNGITAVVHPGGSIRDNEVIETANKYNIAMVTTGWRCFRH